MILLSAQGLSRQFDVDPVFRNVTFDVRPGEKVGLVGPNGTGKTTLLKILAGIDDPDQGRVELHPDADCALLEQQAEFAPDRTLLDEARAGLAHLYELQDESHRLAEQMAAGGSGPEQDRLHRRFDQIQQELERLDAYHIDHRVDEVLLGLGFSEDDYNRPLATFSGGQQNRALLARLLLRAPQVMLLDEPTNHLDIAATEWLENWLSRSTQAIILVSHDRYFLDRVTTRILEMFHGGVTDYKGNFSHYWQQREERNEVLRRTHEKQQEYIARTEDFIRRNKYGQKHAQAADREKKLARIEEVDLPKEIAAPPMQFGEPTRTGDWVIDAVDVAKGFDGPLFRDLTLRIHRGDRLGLLGPNGSGKTTLLRVLLKELEADSGTVRHGTGVKIGYYDQQLQSVPDDCDAVDAIRPDPTTTPGTLRNLLASFGIRGDLALQQVGAMSGGERSKVALAKVAAAQVNVMILDEPTNHLDLWARDSLETALRNFEGTLLFVSHDRYFLDRVARSVLVLDDGQWSYHEGNYSDFVAFRESIARGGGAGPAGGTSGGGKATTAAGDSTGRESADAKSSQPAEKPDTDRRARSKKDRKRKRKFPYRRIQEIEADIASHEELLEQLQNALGDPELHRDGSRVRETMEAFEQTQMELEELYEHWEEADELN